MRIAALITAACLIGMTSAAYADQCVDENFLRDTGILKTEECAVDQPQNSDGVAHPIWAESLSLVSITAKGYDLNIHQVITVDGTGALRCGDVDEFVCETKIIENLSALVHAIYQGSDHKKPEQK